MILLFIFSFSILFIVISKHFFRNWFNPVSIYTFVWGGMLFLYELRLLKYIPLIPEVWFIIIVTYLVFFFGAVTPLIARGSRIRSGSEPSKSYFQLFNGDGKYLAYAILILGIVGLIGTFHSWYILFQKYGTITKILLSANEIYKIRNERNIGGMIPYQAGINYAGIVLAGVYTGYKNRISLVALLPLLAAMLHDLAYFARVGILISFVLFITSFFLYRNYLKIFFSINRKKIISFVILIVLIVVVSASTVRIFRGSYERYRGTDRQLAAFKSGLIITPSIYLYLSAHIGVFSKFFDKDVEDTRIGENTLAPIYNFLAKFALVEKSPFHQKGYFIPMWSNSSTYLRETYADYGLLGLFVIPYFLSFLSTILYIKFFEEGSFSAFILLTSLLTVIFISFFSLIIRGPDLYSAIMILFVVVSIIFRVTKNNSLYKNL